MPFYKWIISTKKTSKKDYTCDISACSDVFDANAVANKRLVNTMRQLSQLITIADDIFAGIDDECKAIFKKTEHLKLKIQRCQEVVDQLNAKTIPVPVGTLSGNQGASYRYISCHAEENNNSSLFSTIPRPPAVDRLRHLANGPSPPVFIPSCKVASEADGESGTISSSSSSPTHIYCQPLQVKGSSKHRCSVDSEVLDQKEKLMTSATKASSCVVPIDISGQPFSRMASFRRSLIHVDFLIRRKKKDKRRNTVAEGETKELKDALHNFINDESQHPMVSNKIYSYQKIAAESKNIYNSKTLDENSKLSRSSTEERNNNSTGDSSIQNSEHLNSVKNCNIPEVECTNITSKTSGVKLEQKNNTNSDNLSKVLPSSSRKKLKGHIPISTISAAMSVAVEMRQLNGSKSEDQPSTGSWRCISNNNSSDSDQKSRPGRSNSISQSFSVNDDNPVPSENSTLSKYRLKEVSGLYTDFLKRMSNEEYRMQAETEVSSCASSENIKPQGDDVTSNTVSTESDVFFISSDESDEDLSDIPYYQEKCHSSASLSTLSDGSLNSLLSQTGTEMTSSTGTLTSIQDSIGQERLPTPPPPPPMILAATAKQEDLMNTVPKSSFLDEKGIITNVEKSNGLSTPKKSSKKSKSSRKITNPLKTDLADLQRNLAENSKNIFTSLVQLKTPVKEQQKLKSKDSESIKSNKSKTQPTFDMYGNNSPKKSKQIPAFIKENVSPVWENEQKNHLQSFFPQKTKPCSIVPPADELDSCNSQFSPCSGSATFLSPNSQFHSTSAILPFAQSAKEVPMKYVHQVTVTPGQREINHENAFYRQIHPKDNNNKLINSDYGSLGRKTNGIYYTHTNNDEPPFPVMKTQNKPQRPLTLHSDKSKLAARVVLDPEGRVIYCTNSLDRKYNNVSPTPSKGSVNSTLGLCVQHSAPKSKENACCRPCSLPFMKYSPIQTFPNITYPEHGQQNNMSIEQNGKICSPPMTLPNTNFSQTPQTVVEFYPNYDTFPSKQNSVQILNHDVNHTEGYHLSQMHQECVPNVSWSSESILRSRQPQFSRASDTMYLHSSASNSSPPNPNISGLPSNENVLTQYNVNLHSKQMERICKSPIENDFHSGMENSYLSPTSQMTSLNSANSPVNKMQQSTMSTEDLFAVIHNCKKRMNIKTDSDISLASSSSRSSSPSYFRPISAKGALAETGFLSPRSSVSCDASGDRRSWADFRPADSFSNERKSLASDRLGPTKPTSMHDFKMLLLQARSNTHVPGPRKSAVEMLKVPLSQDNSARIKSLPLNLSPRNSVSYSVQNSPTSELCFPNGHSTVPFKRGNRVRTSLQSRYTMYPPIFEDCSEESENCRELLQNNPTKSAMAVENGNGNKPMKNKLNNNQTENFNENSKLWM